MASEPRCETCIFWNRPESWLRDRRGACQRIMPGTVPDGMPYVQTSSAYGRLMTPPQFSCPLWDGGATDAR